MKNRTKLGTALVLLALVSTTVTAQNDTVVVVKEPQVVRDTVVKYEEPAKPENKLRRNELGVRYMPTFVSMSFRNSNNEVVQGDVTVSNGIGVMWAGNFSPHVGIQAEVNYLDITQKYKDQNLNRQVHVNYLNLPVLLSLNTNKTKPVNLNFVVGPQFGVNLGSDLQTTGNENTGTVRATVGAKGSDVGAAYGAGLEIALDKAHCIRLDVGYRGFYGLIDAQANQTSADTYNVLVRGSRRTNAGYLGLAWTF